MDNGAVEVADFSFSLEPKRFTINDEVFECAPEMLLDTMARVGSLKLDTVSFREDPEKALAPILSFFDDIFIGDSGARFRARLHDKERPVGVRHILKIIPWLLEVYALRPTEPFSSSSTSHENGGTTSTAGAPSTASSLSDSPHAEDSTSSSTMPAPSLSVS